MDAPLGYTADGLPIYPIQQRRVTTRACVLCHTCGKVIRNNGGPLLGATCMECINQYEATFKLKD